MHVAVVVLGDVGRSPRMRNHALSLAEHGITVDLVGAKLPDAILNNDHVRCCYLPEPPRLPPDVPALLFLLYAPFKLIYQTIALYYILFLKLSQRPDALLVQNPPAIPTLMVVQNFCLWFGSKLIIDWHNFGFSILALRLGKDHFAVRIAKWFEVFFGRSANVHLCVTQAMADEIQRNWNVTGEVKVFYDRPPSSFRRCKVDEVHQLFKRLQDSEPFLLPAENQVKTSTLLTIERNGKIDWRDDRPALIISSTSWTEDEDMTPLLQAIELIEKAAPKKDNHLPPILFIITGKGPLRPQFETRVQGLNLKHVKVVTMWLAVEDYPLLLGAADLGVSMHSSSSGLDLPMKVVDMFGASLPVCSVDYSCITELVTPNETGLLFRTGQELFDHIKSDVLHKMRKNILAQFIRDRWEHAWDRDVFPSLQCQSSSHPTNVVRLKKGGKRFELACYKNKLLEWRQGVETDLDNVLQVHSVFINVSKGQVAAKEDLIKAFKMESQADIIMEILKKGELQVSSLERNHQLSQIQKEVATIIAMKTVNPSTKRPYPVTLIEKAMAELHLSLNTQKSAKQQALEVIKLIQDKNTLPIARAQMRIEMILSSKDGKRLKDTIMPSIGQIEDEDWGSTEYHLTALIDPGQFRVLTDLIQQETKGRGRIDVLSLSETVGGDATIE